MGPLRRALGGLSPEPVTVSASGRESSQMLVVRLKGALTNLQRAEQIVRDVLSKLREPTDESLQTMAHWPLTPFERLETLFAENVTKPPTSAQLRAFSTENFRTENLMRVP